jgi:hypothetical protein
MNAPVRSSHFNRLSPTRKDVGMGNPQCRSIQTVLTLAVRDMYTGKIYFNFLHTAYQVQFTPARFGLTTSYLDAGRLARSQ